MDASVVPAFVYGHTRSTLYRLDAREGRLSRIGDFDCISLSADVADSADGMTDLAIDADGHMFGVGRGEPGAPSHLLVSVDETTGACTRIATVMLDGVATNVQGLSFVPAGTLDPSVEVLVGTNGNGSYFRIDPTTAIATAVGRVMTSSDTRGGDFVSIAGGSSWIITSSNELVTFDLMTGGSLTERTISGLAAGDSLGWGLGFWGGKVYAFTYLGKLYAVDPATAAAVEIPITDAPPGLSFRGAAVTTVAPLVFI